MAGVHMATVLRETLIALRARRQAHQIATRFELGAPIDVRHLSCGACGMDLDLSTAD